MKTMGKVDWGPGPPVIYRPSGIPTVTVLPARHHLTKSRNQVKVGMVSIGKTANDTIRQPLYLRQGYGIFLRKYQRPRREHYGKDRPDERVLFHRNGLLGEYSAAKAKSLYMPGMVMTSYPITIGLDKMFQQTYPELFHKPVTAEQVIAFQEKLARQADYRKTVRRDPDSRRLIAFELQLPTASRISFCDHVEKKPPQPFYVPPLPLPGPEIVPDRTPSFYFTKRDLLRRPQLPMLTVAGSSALLFSSTSFHREREEESSKVGEKNRKAEEEEEARPPQIERPRRNYLPSLMPHVQKRPPATSLTVEEPKTVLQQPTVKVTSERVQPPIVNLADVFPFGAEKGLLAEIDFYQRKKNFPLLLTRKPDVDLKRFNELTPARMLPPELVVRVDTLARNNTRLRALTKKVKETEEEYSEQPGTSSYLEDEVYDPLSYDFNQDVYTDIEKLSTGKKL